jgi:hypothetical protein
MERWTIRKSMAMRYTIGGKRVRRTATKRGLGLIWLESEAFRNGHDCWTAGKKEPGRQLNATNTGPRQHVTHNVGLH